MKTKPLAEMPKVQLRKLLLATPTIADRAWAPARQASARNEGEARDACIKRVLR